MTVTMLNLCQILLNFNDGFGFIFHLQHFKKEQFFLLISNLSNNYKSIIDQ